MSLKRSGGSGGFCAGGYAGYGKSGGLACRKRWTVLATPIKPGRVATRVCITQRKCGNDGSSGSVRSSVLAVLQVCRV